MYIFARGKNSKHLKVSHFERDRTGLNFIFLIYSKTEYIIGSLERMSVLQYLCNGCLSHPNKTT